MNKKILIFGNSGSGKSTLAKNLSQHYLLDVFFLDQILLDDERKKRENEEEIINDIVKNNTSRIIEGNYKKSLEIRIKEATHIIFLNKPTRKCLLGIYKRYFLHTLHLQKRVGLDHLGENRPNITFLKRIISGYPNTKKVIFEISKKYKKDIILYDGSNIGELYDKIDT